VGGSAKEPAYLKRQNVWWDPERDSECSAHGNIWTLRDPIEAIIFVKRVLDDDKIVHHFDFLSMSPHEFQHFLEGWFDFLISLRISQEAAFGVFEDAA
jgi:hypothetical protein